MRKVLAVIGTRPEAIKLGPVIRRLREASSGHFDTRVCVTGQHRELLGSTLHAFEIKPHHDLGVMQADQELGALTSRILAGLARVMDAERPALTLVQGDTTSTFCGALAAFYAGVEIAHIEAGLRTPDSKRPFPEEMNRRCVTQLADLHFAATSDAARNLEREGVRPENVFVTGNTVIDALYETCEAIDNGRIHPQLPPGVDPEKKLVLVTAHRRESFGAGLKGICAAVNTLAEWPGVQVLWPLHPNPQVRGGADAFLRPSPNLLLSGPLEYPDFVEALRRAALVLTDSGGVQEEAPALGKPVLVLRTVTERTETIASGAARLVGCSAQRIVDEAGRLIAGPVPRQAGLASPYGDGHAAERIVAALEKRFAGSAPSRRASHPNPSRVLKFARK